MLIYRRYLAEKLLDCNDIEKITQATLDSIPNKKLSFS